MSGICGRVDFRGFDRPQLAPELERMLARLAHLGPDGCAAAYEPGLGLGQLLDYQTPESTQLREVTCDPETGTKLVADLRLDNREELADKLAIGLPDLRALSDESLLLRAYKRWGIECVEHLLGDFFFAVWSARAQTLWLARDPLGVRPAYYHAHAHGLRFASDLTGLLVSAEVTRAPCLPRIADFIGIQLEERELTFHDGVLRLPAGTVLSVGAAGLRKRAYYQVTLSPELRLRDNREYGDAFRALLVDAVHKRLRTRVTTGFLLSGGLDSSSLVGIARQSGMLAEQGPLRTFSALFPDYPHIDERAWIDQVLATGDFAPSFVRVDRRTPLEYLEKEIAAYAEPFYSPNNYVDSSLLDSAREAGVRLILDGLDGDTTVGHGWEFLGELLRRGRLRRMWRLARALDRHTDRSVLFFLYRHAFAPTAVGLTATLLGRHRVRVPALMNPDFARRVNYTERVWSQRRQRRSELLSPYREQHWGKLASGMLPMSFELAARQAALRGMGRRHPYFDRRLVEFCISLPAEQRLDRGADRLIQRRAVDGFTPESIRTRLTKSIWADNFMDRMRLDEQERIASWLTKDSPVAEYLDMKKVHQACEAARQKRADQPMFAGIWVASALHVWLTQPPAGYFPTRSQT